MKNQEGKIGYEDFFRKAIINLRNPSKSQGIHSVFSGFNEAFRKYFGEDPIKITQELAKRGKIEIRPVRRGVMIYLPGEAPIKNDLGNKALLKILGELPDGDKEIIEHVLSEIAPQGIKTFPKDFLEELIDDKEMFEIIVPGTPLQIDSNSQTIVVSPKRHFRYEAKNPPEAKYVVYAHRIGQNKIKIPKDNHSVFKAVKSYEKYCHGIRDRAYALFLKYTNNEDIAELLTREIEQKLDLKAKRN